MIILTSQVIVKQTRASIPTPASGFVTLFVDSANDHLTQKDSTGAFLDLTDSGAGGGLSQAQLLARLSVGF